MNKNKICLLASIALMLILTLSTTSQATLLTNGDFETGSGAGWTTGANFVIVSSPALDLYAASLIGLDTASQSVAGTAGVQYTLSGELRHGTWNKREATLVLQFLDGASAVISSTEIGRLAAASAADTWFAFSGSAIAPTGTASVNVVLSMVAITGTGAASGTAYFDDIVLVPEPATVAILGLGGLLLLRRRR